MLVEVGLAETWLLIGEGSAGAKSPRFQYGDLHRAQRVGNWPRAPRHPLGSHTWPQTPHSQHSHFR